MAEKKQSTKTAETKKKAQPAKAQADDQAADDAANSSGSNKSAETSGGKAKEKAVSELVGILAERTGLPKNKTKEFVEAYAELLVEELQSTGSVQLAGIGKLKVNERAARQGRNPSTGAAITIAASKQIKFAGGKQFKDRFK